MSGPRLRKDCKRDAPTSNATSNVCECAGVTDIVQELSTKLNECFEIINLQNEKINLLTSLVKELKQSQQIVTVCENIPTYSQISQKNSLKNKPIEQTLLVKTKAEHDHKQVFNEIITKVNPEELKIGVKIAKSTKDGKVFLKCDSSESLEKLKNSIETNLGDKVTLNVPKKLNPRLKVIDVHKNLHAESNENIIRKVKCQNNINADEYLDIVYKSKIEDNCFYLILEADPLVYNQLLHKKKICIGWSSCPIYDHVTVVRCYKCCKFGHIAKKCNSTLVCPTCSGNHERAACESQVKKCVNCEVQNVKYKSNIPVNHTVWDKECQSFLKAIELQRSKINYLT